MEMDNESVQEMLRLLNMIDRIYTAKNDPTFASQGQGMDGYTALANYDDVGEQVHEWLTGDDTP